MDGSVKIKDIFIKMKLHVFIKKDEMEVYNFGNNFDEYFRMLMQRNSQFIFIPHLVLSSMKQQQGLHFFMVSN